MAAIRKENAKPSNTKSGSVLQALEVSHMVDKEITFTRSIWDSPEDQNKTENTKASNEAVM